MREERKKLLALDRPNSVDYGHFHLEPNNMGMLDSRTISASLVSDPLLLHVGVGIYCVVLRFLPRITLFVMSFFFKR